MDTILEPAQLLRLRVASGLTQADLAEALSVPPTYVARLEAGTAEFDGTKGFALARALGCDVASLARRPSPLGHTRPWLRAYADAPKKVVDRYLADTLVAIEAVETLELRKVRDRFPTFDDDVNDVDSIEEFAIVVRNAARVDEGGGVPNVTRAAERLGAIVLPLESELGRHLGMSTRVESVPVIRVGRPNENLPGDRQRFTVAHELGHVLLHSDCPPPMDSGESRRVERQAHRFASAFLMPGDSILNDLDEVAEGRVTLSTLVELKGRWGVAIKSLVVRFNQLGRIDDDHARSLYKQISARGWNKGEPVHVGNERAVWFEKALTKRFPDDDALGLAASHTGLDRSWFERWTAWEVVESPLAEVVPLRRSAETRRDECV